MGGLGTPCFDMLLYVHFHPNQKLLKEDEARQSSMAGVRFYYGQILEVMLSLDQLIAVFCQRIWLALACRAAWSAH